MSQTDFNDLHVLEGLSAVREQVNAALAQAKQQPAANDTAPDYDYPELSDDDNSPHPSEPVAAAAVFTIEALLKQFCYAMPDGKIWDSHKKTLIKKVPFKELVGKALYEEWLNHENRRVVDQDIVKREALAAQKQGRGGLGEALRRYVYLYPETTAWDRKKRQIVSAQGLKMAIADCYEDWVKHPDREEIDIENLVFDPTESVNPETHINMFRGLPIQPADTAKGCRHIFEMVKFLCNGDNEVFTWLMKWLAYPLQNVGAKMATAVMMHSVIQGSGKSLFFDGVMRKIYGEYSATLGQHQLESQYTDWRSQMLYGVFEEIFSRDQKYSHTGTLKQMITGETMRIEKKFISGWEEANHMNAIFLSNEIQPFPVEPNDRRMLVIWPEGKLADQLRDGVVKEIANGGVHAFYRYLLDLDLTGFHTHFEPPMTAAKERLIDFGRAGWDLFYQQWSSGLLYVPYQSCLVSDLYVVFKQWCSDDNERLISKNKLSQFLSAMPGVRHRKDCHYTTGATKSKGALIQIGDVPEGQTQQIWLGKEIAAFKKVMNP